MLRHYFSRLDDLKMFNIFSGAQHPQNFHENDACSIPNFNS